MFDIVRGILEGDLVSTARAISIVESDPERATELIKNIFPHTGKAHIIGVTGPPGVGKSTLTSALIEAYRGMNRTVGVIAVDSSSPFSGGALLGDRIRMHKHFSDEKGVFIRSMATRGNLGGLSRATQGACYILDARGMNVVIIETVGVGQAEVDIMDMADTILVVLAPGLGDDIQALKAGVMEIGDIFIVNKADREGAEDTFRDIRSVLSLGAKKRTWEPKVFKTIASESEGIGELIGCIETHREFITKNLSEQDKSYRMKLFANLIKERVAHRILNSREVEADLQELTARIGRKEIDPFTASDVVLNEILGRCL